MDLPLPPRMISLASWQLLLLLCVASFGEPLAKMAPVVNPEPTGTHRPGKGGKRVSARETRCIFQTVAKLLTRVQFLHLRNTQGWPRPSAVSTGGSVRVKGLSTLTPL